MKQIENFTDKELKDKIHFKVLEQENDTLRADIDCELFNKNFEKDFVWKKINLLIENEIEQEKLSNQ